MIETTHLEWDSAFFNKKIARLQVNSVPNISTGLKMCLEQGYELIYVLLPDNTPLISDIDGLNLVDRKITYYRDLPASETYLQDQHIHSYTATSPNEQFYQLAIRSGNYSRFKLDPNISQSLFVQLYHLWAENSVNRSIADEVFVYKEGETIQGMVTLSIKNKIGSIGLIAVNEDASGKGIGKTLLQKSFAFFRAQGVHQLTVVTQKDNLQACYFYEKNGFKTQFVQQIYHFWK